MLMHASHLTLLATCRTFWGSCPPQIVLSFVAVWCKNNPDYEITILTLENYRSHISSLRDLEKASVTGSLTHQSVAAGALARE